jgi:hypothetical protein
MRLKESVKRKKKLESSRPNNLMSKMKTKKKLQKIQCRKRKPESARVT